MQKQYSSNTSTGNFIGNGLYLIQVVIMFFSFMYGYDTLMGVVTVIMSVVFSISTIVALVVLFATIMSYKQGLIEQVYLEHISGMTEGMHYSLAKNTLYAVLMYLTGYEAMLIWWGTLFTILWGCAMFVTYHCYKTD